MRSRSFKRRVLVSAGLVLFAVAAWLALKEAQSGRPHEEIRKIRLRVESDTGERFQWFVGALMPDGAVYVPVQRGPQSRRGFMDRVVTVDRPLNPVQFSGHSRPGDSEVSIPPRATSVIVGLQPMELTAAREVVPGDWNVHMSPIYARTDHVTITGDETVRDEKLLDAIESALGASIREYDAMSNREGNVW